jgi:hypothetical protein
MTNAVFWDVTPCGFLRTDVSEERIASIIRVERISELGTALAVHINTASSQRTAFLSGYMKRIICIHRPTVLAGYSMVKFQLNGMPDQTSLD